MSEKYQCPNCDTEFDSSSAYCEDWREKDRSFACPNCKTFYRVILTKRQNWPTLFVAQTFVISLNYYLLTSWFAGQWYSLAFCVVFVMITTSLIDRITGKGPNFELQAIES